MKNINDQLNTVLKLFNNGEKQKRFYKINYKLYYLIIKINDLLVTTCKNLL